MEDGRENSEPFFTSSLISETPNISVSHLFVSEDEEHSDSEASSVPSTERDVSLETNESFRVYKDEVLIVEDSVISHVEQQKPTDPPQMRGTVRGSNYVGPHINTIHEWIENVRQASLNVTTPGRYLIRYFDSFTQKRHIPLDVGVTYELENSLQCLTACLRDTFFDHKTDLNLLVEHFSRIPDLTMTIMLIEDDKDRKRIMDYPIVKWAMMSKYSFVSKKSEGASIEQSFWLIDLIESGKTPLRKKVIEYLNLISIMTAEDLLPEEYRISKNDLSSFESNRVFEHKKKFHKCREDLFMALIQKPNFIPTLLSLSDDQLEDVAGTGVIKYAVEWSLYHPIGVSVVFSDLVSQFVITFSIRYTAHYWVMVEYGMITDTEISSLSDILLFSFATLGSVYWIFRRGCVLISLFSISPKTYLKYMLNFWNLMDIVTLCLSSYIYIISLMYVFVDVEEKYPQFDSNLQERWFTTVSILVGLLWFNLLGLFKVLNKKFATLILAISKIATDMIMFIIVVIVTILATGDMLHIYISTNFQVCPENNPNTTNSSQMENTSTFCEQNRMSSYIAIYNMYIGDISFDDFSGTMLTIFVYLGLTFFGVIILLNVIIALVCDSYEKSNEQSERLFGRARVSYVATIIAFEDLIKPKEFKELRGRRFLIQIFVEFFKFAISSMALTILIFVFFSIHEAMVSWIGWVLATSVVLPLLMAWATFSSFLITGWEKTDSKFTMLRRLQNNILLKNYILRAAIFFTRHVLGTHGFNSTNELNRAPVTKQNDRQNEVETNETFIVKESINEKLSTIQKKSESNQNEIKEIKNDLNDVKNELKGITEMLGKMIRA